MGSAQRSETKGELQTQVLPGVYGTPESARIATQVQGLIGQRQQSPFATQLQSILRGAPSTEENALMSAVQKLTGGGR